MDKLRTDKVELENKYWKQFRSLEEKIDVMHKNIQGKDTNYKQ